MNLYDLRQRAKAWLRHAPGIYQWRHQAYVRRFHDNRRSNLFHGVFDSFQAAGESAPDNRPSGYDNAPSARLYLGDAFFRPHSYDYPAALWMARSFQEGLRSVADLGGSVGIKFYAFQKLMDLPQDVRWTVIDVPAVAQCGREVAGARSAGQRLDFSSSLEVLDDVDVLLASGALQYLPQGLGEILAGLRRKPRRLIINTTPLHESLSFFTLNSIGTAYCPYRIGSRPEFMAQLETQGYALRDEWRNDGKRMRLPFNPGYDVDGYSGMCLDFVAGS
ncbi:MAG: TIGR04325 family methyltransferase [Aquabacterium sp.]